MNRVIAYIDGFNVYHSLDQVQPYHKYKWIDYWQLASCFVQARDRLVSVQFFTAFPQWNAAKAARHAMFVDVQKSRGVAVIEGQFREVTKQCRLCRRLYKTFEEKQTDVNIALAMLRDAHNDAFDSALLISGDTDLVPPIKMIRRSFPKKVMHGVIPIGRNANAIRSACTKYSQIKERHLTSALLPDPVVLPSGTVLARPSLWT